MLFVRSGILVRHKKNIIVSFEVTWIELENIMLNEISQTQKENTTLVSFVYNMQAKKLALCS